MYLQTYELRCQSCQRIMNRPISRYHCHIICFKRIIIKCLDCIFFLDRRVCCISVMDSLLTLPENREKMIFWPFRQFGVKLNILIPYPLTELGHKTEKSDKHKSHDDKINFSLHRGVGRSWNNTALIFPRNSRCCCEQAAGFTQIPG